jgi:hypothetical protein
LPVEECAWAADTATMFLARHAFAASIVVVALAATAAIFAFARPRYVPEHQSQTLDMTKRHHLTVQQVRAAFRAYGIRLDYGGPLFEGAGGSWLVTLAAVRPPVDSTHVQVSVFGPKSKVGWGESNSRYEALFDNVAVTYDGSSDDVLRRAKAAVADLRSTS